MPRKVVWYEIHEENILENGFRLSPLTRGYGIWIWDFLVTAPGIRDWYVARKVYRNWYTKIGDLMALIIRVRDWPGEYSVTLFNKQGGIPSSGIATREDS